METALVGDFTAEQLHAMNVERAEKERAKTNMQFNILGVSSLPTLYVGFAAPDWIAKNYIGLQDTSNIAHYNTYLGTLIAGFAVSVVIQIAAKNEQDGYIHNSRTRNTLKIGMGLAFVIAASSAINGAAVSAGAVYFKDTLLKSEQEKTAAEKQRVHVEQGSGGTSVERKCFADSAKLTTEELAAQGKIIVRCPPQAAPKAP